MINGQSPVTTQGDLIQGDSGGNEVRLPIGTAGQVLKVDSAGTSAEWANAQPAGLTLEKDILKTTPLGRLHLAQLHTSG